MNLKEHEKQIRELIKAENECDTDWKFALKKCSYTLALIWWEFLADAHGRNDGKEKALEDCFHLEMELNEKGEGDWIIVRAPEGNHIALVQITNGATTWKATNISEAIEYAMEQIWEYAYSKY